MNMRFGSFLYLEVLIFVCFSLSCSINSFIYPKNEFNQARERMTLVETITNGILPAFQILFSELSYANFFNIVDKLSILWMICAYAYQGNKAAYFVLF